MRKQCDKGECLRFDLESRNRALLADHEENARILGFLVNELQGRVEVGKLGAIQSCLDRCKRSIAKATGAE